MGTIIIYFIIWFRVGFARWRVVFYIRVLIEYRERRFGEFILLGWNLVLFLRIILGVRKVFWMFGCLVISDSGVGVDFL